MSAVTENDLLQAEIGMLKADNEWLKLANEELKRGNELLETTNERIKRDNEQLKAGKEDCERQLKAVKQVNELDKETEGLLMKANASLQAQNRDLMTQITQATQLVQSLTHQHQSERQQWENQQARGLGEGPTDTTIKPPTKKRRAEPSRNEIRRFVEGERKAREEDEAARQKAGFGTSSTGEEPAQTSGDEPKFLDKGLFEAPWAAEQLVFMSQGGTKDDSGR